VRWYQKEPIEAIPVPVLGPDIMDPRKYELFVAQMLQEETQAVESATSVEQA
jgi:hypothetical protein